jgi:hypothetical protein
MSQTYLTTAQLAERIGYNVRTIRNSLVDSVLIEGVHYIHPFGRRKMLFIWEKIEEDMGNHSVAKAPLIPMSNGSFARG